MFACLLIYFLFPHFVDVVNQYKVAYSFTSMLLSRPEQKKKKTKHKRCDTKRVSERSHLHIFVFDLPETLLLFVGTKLPQPSIPLRALYHRSVFVLCLQ